jgi:hypothetical protein
METSILFPSEVWDTIKLYLFENSYVNVDEYDSLNDDDVFLHYGVIKHILQNKSNILSICIVNLNFYITAENYLMVDNDMVESIKNDLLWVNYETNIFNKNSEYTYYIMNTLRNHKYLAPTVELYIKSFYNKNKFIIRRKILDDNLYNCLLQIEQNRSY